MPHTVVDLTSEETPKPTQREAPCKAPVHSFEALNSDSKSVEKVKVPRREQCGLKGDRTTLLSKSVIEDRRKSGEDVPPRGSQASKKASTNAFAV